MDLKQLRSRFKSRSKNRHITNGELILVIDAIIEATAEITIKNSDNTEGENWGDRLKRNNKVL